MRLTLVPASVVAVVASALPATAHPAQQRASGLAAACTSNPATPRRRLRAA